MRVLVLGGTGWVGHHIASQLLEAGHTVVIGCRGKTQRFAPPATAQRVLVDKGNPDTFRAAQVGDVEVVIDTVPTPDSVHNVFEAFAGRIRHYIHCSSTGVYVPLQRVPATEEHPWRESTGENFMQKVQVDALALELHVRHGFPVTVLRPSNIVGPGMIPLDIWGARRAGYWRRLHRSLPVVVPGDGATLLQPCHVKDVAKAFVLASGQPQSVGGVFNISAAYSITLDQYVDASKKVLGSASPVTHMPTADLCRAHPDAEGMLDKDGLRFLCQHMCFDISRARTELGYIPAFTPEQGIQDSIAWMFRTNLL